MARKIIFKILELLVYAVMIYIIFIFLSGQQSFIYEGF